MSRSVIKSRVEGAAGGNVVVDEEREIEFDRLVLRICGDPETDDPELDPVDRVEGESGAPISVEKSPKVDGGVDDIEDVDEEDEEVNGGEEEEESDGEELDALAGTGGEIFVGTEEEEAESWIEFREPVVQEGERVGATIELRDGEESDKIEDKDGLEVEDPEG